MKSLKILLLLLVLLGGCASDIALRREKIVQGARVAVIGELGKVQVHFLSQIAPHAVLILLDGFRADEFAKEMGNYDLSRITAREFVGRLKGSSVGADVVFEEFYASLESTGAQEQATEGDRNGGKDYTKIAEELDLRYLISIEVTPELELEWLPKQVIDPSLVGKVYPVLSAKAEMIDLKSKETLWRRSKRVVSDKILHSLDEYQSDRIKLAKEAWESTVPLLVDELIVEFMADEGDKKPERSAAPKSQGNDKEEGMKDAAPEQ